MNDPETSNLPVDVGSVSDVPEGKMRGVDVGRARILLTCVKGRIHAIGGICTHQIAHLEDGQLDGCVVRCPRHGAGFDVRTGEALDLPAESPVPVFDVAVSGGRIFIARRPRGGGQP